jgi:hypothetical protein
MRRGQKEKGEGKGPFGMLLLLSLRKLLSDTERRERGKGVWGGGGTIFGIEMLLFCVSRID